jgi:DNA-binding protein YbaB
VLPTVDQFTGSAADGRVRAVVDARGLLVDLRLDASFLNRSPETVANAIIAAVREAQEAAAPAEPAVDDQQIAADLEAIDREADRRLAELNVIVSDLIRQRER